MPGTRSGQRLFRYFADEPGGPAPAANLLTRDEARLLAG
jgi:hypothetical protein